MRASLPLSLINMSFVLKLYILFFILSILSPVAYSRPQPISSLLLPSSQILGVRSEASAPPSGTPSTDSAPPTSSSTTSTSTTEEIPTTTTTTHHTHHTSSAAPPTPTPSPTTSTTTISSLSSISTSTSDSLSSSISGTPSVTLIPAVAQSTLIVGTTDSPSPTTFVASNNDPDVTDNAASSVDTSLPNEGATNGASSGGFLHNTGAMAGTFTVAGVIVAGLAFITIVKLKKKKDQAINFGDESGEGDDYVVNDRSGRTGFASVNYGDTSITEMSERQYSDRPYMGNEVEHTLGQEIIQQPPFDPFHNNFAFVDNSYSSDLSPSHQQSQYGTADQKNYQIGQHYDDLQLHDESAIQRAPWASHTGAPTTEPDIPFRYEQHPYANDAVHVTPLHRQPSERAEYGLAC